MCSTETQTPPLPTASHSVGFPLLPAGPPQAWETLPPLQEALRLESQGYVVSPWSLSFQELQGLFTDELTPFLRTQEDVVLPPPTDEKWRPTKSGSSEPLSVGAREWRAESGVVSVFHPLSASVSAPLGRGRRREETRSAEGGFGQARREKQDQPAHWPRRPDA